MAITDWPEDERPRERLLKQGAGALSDAELFAIFLRTGVAGRSAVDLARDLLTHFGGVRGLLNASRRDFTEAKGLGDAKFAQLQAVLELARRHFAEELAEGAVIDSPEATRRYLQAQLRDAAQEVFAVLFLDQRHRVLAFERLFYGTINQSAVHPREVVKAVLRHNAAAVILAHNHPSGVAEPSTADREITLRLRDALNLIDVRLLDHMIVGDRCTSMAELGMI
ncbi:RadC family protein [Halothiobacillus neapolitanus]|uniref:DNA repair protein RadC n=1 Tax=Halothiobacillus neapolitanus (strain ATCC 23641 / DSM 15147 / CIP 104769 / NCIMB 8539 / c2) TaxID=555778 RepID=D0KW68_HALNC|nr:DNA repair protein RadC [Halothiobacillus neapolitanus]ACX96971.1 DNA repair protein RadC [Halothiobacillus neapolitanus c2]TDN59810.1 DNA replication and repair protein RadC [Halothiobacillus neapolitanus]